MKVEYSQEMEKSYEEKINDLNMVYGEGNLDEVEKVEALKCILGRLYDEGEKEIILNIDKTQTINTHCLSNIMFVYRILKDRGGCLYITPPKGKVKSLLQAHKLDKILPVYTG